MRLFPNHCEYVGVRGGIKVAYKFGAGAEIHSRMLDARVSVRMNELLIYDLSIISCGVFIVCYLFWMTTILK